MGKEVCRWVKIRKSKARGCEITDNNDQRINRNILTAIERKSGWQILKNVIWQERSSLKKSMTMWTNGITAMISAQFLGLNEEEEDVWIDEGDDALYELLEQQREG